MKKSIKNIPLLVIVVCMLISGIGDIMQIEAVKKVSINLGYPLYFFSILGIMKLIGVVLLIIPKLPLEIKILAYSGFFFDFLFAFISLLYNGSIIAVWVPFLLLFVLITSFYFNILESEAYKRLK